MVIRTMLSGHCHNERDEPNNGHHDRCAGAYSAPNGGLYTCPCANHQGENRCRYCLHDHRGGIAGYDIASRRCVDTDACSLRSTARHLQTPLARMEQERARAGRRPGRDCECGCGGQTRGGRFQPGHDAKLKGALLRRAADGDDSANDELRRRGWAK